MDDEFGPITDEELDGATVELRREDSNSLLIGGLGCDCKLMRDDLSRIKTLCRRRYLGEISEREFLRSVYTKALKHGGGHHVDAP